MRRGRCWSNAVSVPPIAFVEPREQQSPWVVCRLSSGSAERIRAWLVRLATRSGPSTAGSWQPCLAGTWPLPLVRPYDDLAPGDPGAIDNHDRHHHHARVGRTGGLVSPERHRAQSAGWAEPQLPVGRGGRQPAEATPIRGASRLPKTPPAAPTQEDDSDPPEQRPGPARPLNRPLLAPPSPAAAIRSLGAATTLRQSQQLIEPKSHAHSCRPGLAFLPKLTLGLLVRGERHLGPTYESLPDVEWPRAEAGFAGLVPGSPASTHFIPYPSIVQIDVTNASSSTV